MKTEILNNIETDKTWIDVETVAKLKDVTKRAVRLALNSGKYEFKVEKNRGGRTYKIKLSTLEEDLQIKYINEYYNDFSNINNEVIELNNFEVKQEKLISASQKKGALAKYDLIMCWLEFRREYNRDKKLNKFKISEKDKNADTKFLELYNTGYLYEEIFKHTIFIRFVMFKCNGKRNYSSLR